MTRIQSGTPVPSAIISTECLDALAELVEALHGGGELTHSLTRVMMHLRADCAFVMRQMPGRATPKIISSADAQADKMPPTHRQSYLQQLIGDHLSHLRGGTVLSLQECEKEGMIDRDNLITLRTRLSASNVRDLLILRLSGSGAQADFLELQFDYRISAYDLELIAMLGPRLAKTWTSRLPGTAEKAAIRSNVRAIAGPSDPLSLPILDASNPLDLTRSEYRICVLVSEGMLLRSIARELSVQEATVRSHLRSIFMKTGTTCHVELLHRLTVERTQKDGLADTSGTIQAA